MHHFLYLIGGPGSGKTTALRAAIGDEAREKAVEIGEPFYHSVYPGGTVEIGRCRETFGGTDALPMNVGPRAVKWILEVGEAAREAGVIARCVAEGDRLAYPAFFEAVKAGFKLDVWLFDVPWSVAQERYRLRGSKQDSAWLKSRFTKAWTLAEKYGTRRINATLPLDTIVEQLKQHPALAGLRR